MVESGKVVRISCGTEWARHAPQDGPLTGLRESRGHVNKEKPVNADPGRVEECHLVPRGRDVYPEE